MRSGRGASFPDSAQTPQGGSPTPGCTPARGGQSHRHSSWALVTAQNRKVPAAISIKTSISLESRVPLPSLNHQA